MRNFSVDSLPMGISYIRKDAQAFWLFTVSECDTIDNVLHVGQEGFVMLGFPPEVQQEDPAYSTFGTFSSIDLGSFEKFM